MDKNLYIADLISKKIKGELSSEEETMLHNWLNEGQANADLYKRIVSNQQVLIKLVSSQVLIDG